MGVYLINVRKLALALPKGRPIDVGLQTDIGHGQARAPVEAGGYFLYLVSILKNFFSLSLGIWTVLITLHSLCNLQMAQLIRVLDPYKKFLYVK